MQEPNAEKEIFSQVKNLHKYGSRINKQEYATIFKQPKRLHKKSPKRVAKSFGK
jgi:hypothetical protein